MAKIITPTLEMKGETNKEIEDLLKKSAGAMNTATNNTVMELLSDDNAGQETTSTNRITQDEIVQDWKEVAKELSLHAYKYPEMPKDNRTWLQKKIEKIMNWFGWYRQTTVYLIDFNALSKPFDEFIRFKDEKYD